MIQFTDINGKAVREDVNFRASMLWDGEVEPNEANTLDLANAFEFSFASEGEECWLRIYHKNDYSIYDAIYNN